MEWVRPYTILQLFGDRFLSELSFMNLCEYDTWFHLFWSTDKNIIQNNIFFISSIDLFVLDFNFVRICRDKDKVICIRDTHNLNYKLHFHSYTLDIWTIDLCILNDWTRVHYSTIIMNHRRLWSRLFSFLFCQKSTKTHIDRF